ncbi:MAG: DUF3795 domain-containing protein [Clostridia bacterium]|nr:DUF3795 domain-containing protein [Clostridia bacterium]
MSMDNLAKCGLDCGTCRFKEPCNCLGCNKAEGKMFWGECNIAKCCIDKGASHCGMCGKFPCEDLKAFAYDKEHGDPQGSRIINLRRKMGEQV